MRSTSFLISARNSSSACHSSPFRVLLRGERMLGIVNLAVAATFTFPLPLPATCVRVGRELGAKHLVGFALLGEDGLPLAAVGWKVREQQLPADRAQRGSAAASGTPSAKQAFLTRSSGIGFCESSRRKRATRSSGVRVGGGGGGGRGGGEECRLREEPPPPSRGVLASSTALLTSDARLDAARLRSASHDLEEPHACGGHVI